MRYIGADLHKENITFCFVETDHQDIRVAKRQRMIFCEFHRPPPQRSCVGSFVVQRSSSGSITRSLTSPPIIDRLSSPPK